MNSILEKLDPYQILTNLLPGAFFGFGIRFFLNLELPTKHISEDVIIYYFMGFIISRIGSLVIEPILKKFGFLKFAPYQDFVNASKANSKIDTLSTANNYVRSLLTSALLFPVIGGLRVLALNCSWFSCNWRWVLLLFIIIIFLFSYKKQTEYIYKRVKAVLSQNDNLHQ